MILKCYEMFFYFSVFTKLYNKTFLPFEFLGPLKFPTKLQGRDSFLKTIQYYLLPHSKLIFKKY